MSPEIPDWIIESNKIEGVYEPDEHERSYQAWLWFKTQELTLETIQQLQGMIMQEHLKKMSWALGKWRTVDVRVGFRICPDWRMVPTLMYAWRVADGEPQTELRAIQSHVEFEKIHPFVDGNGRAGRMILNYQVQKLGLKPFLIKYSERHDYYKWFEGK